MVKRFRPGVSFSDFVLRDAATKRSRVDDGEGNDFRRGWLVWLVVVIMFAGLAVRLAGLELVYGERYRQLSEENRVKTIKLRAPRGEIVDRNGVVLADSALVDEKWVRRYPLGAATAHVLGYVSEVSEEEVGLLKAEGRKYEVGDNMGRTGMEGELEAILRGRDGGRLVEVDHEGEVARELGRREPEAGIRVKLTLDASLQRRAMEAMGDKKGAVVVSDPNNGEVLALVSTPSFDPNKLGEEYEKLVGDTNLPFLNRSVGAIYPPGSTFKMVTAAAAIGEGKVPADFTFVDEGIIRVNNFSYTNWLFTKRGGTEGRIGWARAIARSTDTFFYKVGEMTTPELLAKWAQLLGLGDKTGIDVPGEVAGLIPTPDWKEMVKGESWFLGNTFHMAIGQGDVLVTPVQVNLMTNILATEGKKCRLHVVGEPARGDEGACDEVELPREAVEVIDRGMVGACSSGGTSFVLFDWNEAAQARVSRGTYVDGFGKNLPVVACKTGTAEYVAEDGRIRTHGWLTAWAPADEPRVSVTVVVEGGGEGSNVAAPVVRQVMAKYFGVEDRYPYHAIPREVGE